MSGKKVIVKIFINPLCEKCGKPIYQDEPRFVLYQKFYHAKCGYNN